MISSGKRNRSWLIFRIALAIEPPRRPRDRNDVAAPSGRVSGVHAICVREPGVCGTVKFHHCHFDIRRGSSVSAVVRAGPPSAHADKPPRAGKRRTAHWTTSGGRMAEACCGRRHEHLLLIREFTMGDFTFATKVHARSVLTLAGDSARCGGLLATQVLHSTM